MLQSGQLLIHGGVVDKRTLNRSRATFSCYVRVPSLQHLCADVLVHRYTLRALTEARAPLPLLDWAAGGRAQRLQSYANDPDSAMQAA